MPHIYILGSPRIKTIQLGILSMEFRDEHPDDEAFGAWLSGELGKPPWELTDAVALLLEEVMRLLILNRVSNCLDMFQIHSMFPFDNFNAIQIEVL